jgi:hypothetical protein
VQRRFQLFDMRHLLGMLVLEVIILVLLSPFKVLVEVPVQVLVLVLVLVTALVLPVVLDFKYRYC